MSSRTIATLIQRLTPDPWRVQIGFSPEVESALGPVVDPSTPDAAVVQILGEWLSKHQPCLFGRIAAKKGLLSYCLISEEELAESDEVVARKIQNARREWTRLGFEGLASGFIIVLRSRTLATAAPDATVKAIAQRVAFLYLKEEVATDRVYLDQIYLEQPGTRRTTWEWVTGVNYFSAQGDKRWWQDHRIPTGMAFSVNSVGHMVKAGKLSRAMRDLEEVMETAEGDITNPVVDSLEKALELAMRTIALASDGPSGKERPWCHGHRALGLRSALCRCRQLLRTRTIVGIGGGITPTSHFLQSISFRKASARRSSRSTNWISRTYLIGRSIIQTSTGWAAARSFATRPPARAIPN